MEVLGKLLNYDLNMSPFKDTACASCHMPYAGFSGPIPSVNLTMIAYPGSAHYRANKRTAQRYTYSPDFPVLNYNAEQGLFFGGNFWDGRATGYMLQSPDAEQAQHPPVDPGEMGFPDTACIAYRLSDGRSTNLSLRRYGATPWISTSQPTPSRSATPRKGRRCSARTPSPLSYRPKTAPRQTTFTITGASPFPSFRRLSERERLFVEIRRLPGGQLHHDCRRDGWLPTVQRQRQLQFLPPRRKIHPLHGPKIWLCQRVVEPDRHRHYGPGEPYVHLLRICE